MVEKRQIFLQYIHPLVVALAYIFLYLPIVVLVTFAFNASEQSVRWTGFTLHWFVEMVNNAELLSAIKVSLIVAVVATMLSLAMGTGLIVALKWWQSRLAPHIFYGNILLPEIVFAIGLLSVFTFLQIPLGYGSLIAGHTIIGLGFVVPIVRARFVELDPFLTEASADLGATHWQTFRKILLPLLVPSLVAASLLVFTLSLDDFLIAFFCSSSNVQTLSVYVFSLVREGISPTINAVSVCLLVLSSVCVLILTMLKVIDQVVTHE
jgi:spermidine/putrescine transport system permease protein